MAPGQRILTVISFVHQMQAEVFRMSLPVSDQLLKAERGWLQHDVTLIYVLSACELRLTALRSLCTEENGCQLVGTAKGVPEDLHMLQDGCPDIVVLDMDIFQGAPLRFLAEAVSTLKHIAYVLVLASYLDIESAYAAMAHGASGYLLTSTSLQHCMHAFHIVSCGGTWLEEDLRQKILRPDTSSPGGEDKPEPRLLSQRELQILQRIAKGETNKAIAEGLYLSESSVKTYWQRVLTKLNAFSKVEAVTRAMKLGLLVSDSEPDEHILSIISPRLRTSLLPNQQKALPSASSY
jgi:DNA-binding NarL/FixJ family response regulator